MNDYHCSGSGGSHGGHGGAGGTLSRNRSEQFICNSTYPLKYYSGRDARLEGSGGGNGELRNAQKDTGGAGGGIIWLNSPGTTSI